MTDRPAHLGDDLLNAWIDGAATPGEDALVSHHLASCELCRARADELRAVATMLGQLPEITPPRSFALTPEQAKKPTPIRERSTASNIIRLLPIVRTLSVAAMLAVLILGATLVVNPQDDTVTLEATTSLPSGETAGDSGSLGETNPASAPQERGEVVDRGQAASAHDSTNASLQQQSAPAAIETTNAGLTGMETATIVVGVVALLLGATWMWMSMAIRGGSSRQ